MARANRFEGLSRLYSSAAVFFLNVTILFVAVTSVLFFDGVGKIFPFFYASRSPLP